MCLATWFNDRWVWLVLNPNHSFFFSPVVAFDKVRHHFTNFSKLGSVGLSMWIYWPDPPLKAFSQHWESEKQMKNVIKILAHCHGCGCTNAMSTMCMDGALRACVCVLVGVWAAVNTRPCLHQPQSFPLHLTFPSPKSEHPEYPRKPLTSGFWDGHSFAIKGAA